MSLPAPSAWITGSVVDDERLFDPESGCAGKRAAFLIGKDVATGNAMRFSNVPSDLNVATVFVPGREIAEDAEDRWQRSVMTRVVAVIHIDEDPALRR